VTRLEHAVAVGVSCGWWEAILLVGLVAWAMDFAGYYPDPGGVTWATDFSRTLSS
jgi:hypothetical protein